MVSIDVLAAVHHPVRRRIVDHLVLNGPSRVGAMATAFGQQVGSISHHLRMLERAEVVERAPELASDGRTSWWRYTGLAISWSADDFADAPADLHRARVAERINVEHQVKKLVDWQRRSATYDEEWRRAAFSSDSLAKATPVELHDLLRRLEDAIGGWRDEIDADDGAEREPVFVFMHAFPSRP
ncbi:MAG: ArsR/SmtB family transcription factor [Marmoricola sp.]